MHSLSSNSVYAVATIILSLLISPMAAQEDGRLKSLLVMLPRTPSLRLKSSTISSDAIRIVDTHHSFSKGADDETKSKVGEVLVLMEEKYKSEIVVWAEDKLYATKFQFKRSDDDHAELKKEPLPTFINPAKGSYVKIKLNSVGSFILTAERNDVVRYLNLVIVRSRLLDDVSRPHPQNIRWDVGKGRATVFYGHKTRNGKINPGITMDAWVSLIGGGGNGRLGLDKVEAGWVNNIKSEKVTGKYERNHSLTTFYTPDKYVDNQAMVVTPSTDAKNIPKTIKGPFLDTARKNIDRGGIQITMNASNCSDKQDLSPLGMKIHVTCRDSPNQSVQLDHQGFNGNWLDSLQARLEFRAFVTLWSRQNKHQFVVVTKYDWVCDSFVDNFTWKANQPRNQQTPTYTVKQKTIEIAKPKDPITDPQRADLAGAEVGGPKVKSVNDYLCPTELRSQFLPNYGCRDFGA